MQNVKLGSTVRIFAFTACVQGTMDVQITFAKSKESLASYRSAVLEAASIISVTGSLISSYQLSDGTDIIRAVVSPKLIQRLMGLEGVYSITETNMLYKNIN